MEDVLVKSISLNIPDQYQTVLSEHMDIVKKEFVTANYSTLSDLDLKAKQKDLLHFLTVIYDAFGYSKAVGNDTGMDVNSSLSSDCITVFRDIFRQHLRGVHYLSLAKFKEISSKAEMKTLEHFQMLKTAKFKSKLTEEESELLRLISLERHWLEKVNLHRRRVDIDAVTAEIVKKFRAKIDATFANLFEKRECKVINNYSKRYHLEPSEFNGEIDKLVNQYRQQFKEEIPFKEQEDAVELSFLCTEFTTNLNTKVIHDLKTKYRNRIKEVKSQMNCLAEKAAKKYGVAMSKALEEQQAQLEVENIFNDHKQALEKFAPKFEIESDNTVVAKEYQVYCWNRYGVKVYKQFSKMINDVSGSARLKTELCENESKSGLKDCLQRVRDTFDSYGLGAFTSEFEKHVMGGITSMITYVKETNKQSTESLIKNAKPFRIFVHAENALIENCKETYVDKLVSTLRQSANYPKAVDNKMLDRCHFVAITQADSLFHLHCIALLDQDHVPELLKQLNKFAASFIAHVKANAQFFVDSIQATVIPFKAVPGTDTFIENGVICKEATRHQCVTVMKECEDKSLEELRLEYQRKTWSLTTLKFPTVVPDDTIKLSSKFDKGLNFTSKEVDSLNKVNINFSQSPITVPPSLSPQLFTIGLMTTAAAPPPPPQNVSSSEQLRYLRRSYKK